MDGKGQAGGEQGVPGHLVGADYILCRRGLFNELVDCGIDVDRQAGDFLDSLDGGLRGISGHPDRDRFARETLGRITLQPLSEDLPFQPQAFLYSSTRRNPGSCARNFT